MCSNVQSCTTDESVHTCACASDSMHGSAVYAGVVVVVRAVGGNLEAVRPLGEVYKMSPAKRAKKSF